MAKAKSGGWPSVEYGKYPPTPLAENAAKKRLDDPNQIGWWQNQRDKRHEKVQYTSNTGRVEPDGYNDYKRKAK